MSTPEDLAAKLGFIAAFFDDLLDKAAYCATLYHGNRDDEARLLTCVYLESLGNGVFHPSTRYAANFCHLLAAYGDTPRLSLVTPRWLLDRLPWRSANQQTATAIRTLLTSLPQEEAFLLPELEDLARRHLSLKAQHFLERESWLGTTAMVIYGELRSPAAHFFGSPAGILFSRTTWRGQPLGRIGFEDLHTALTKAVEAVRALSLSSGYWFGNPDVP